MVKLVTGGKGTGKSKRMIEMANELSTGSKGNLVFIDDDRRPMYDLNHIIRFICMEDYTVDGEKEFLGFLRGIIANDHDIEAIYIDGLLKILGLSADSLKDFMDGINKLSQKFEIDFIISISCEDDKLPKELKEYDMV